MKPTTYELPDMKKSQGELQSAKPPDWETRDIFENQEHETHVGRACRVWGRLDSSHMQVSELYLWKAARNTKGDIFGKMTEERW